MKEKDVEKIVRNYIKYKYLTRKDWKLPKYCNKIKEKGIHGIDISLYNQKLGDRFVIEVKKWSDTAAANHNAFYGFFGQLLSRIENVPKKNYQKRRKMIIAAPRPFIKLIYSKLHTVQNSEGKKLGMKGGWTLFGRLVNLRLWVIDMRKKSVVKELTWKDMLKENIEI